MHFLDTRSSLLLFDYSHALSLSVVYNWLVAHNQKHFIVNGFAPMTFYLLAVHHESPMSNVPLSLLLLSKDQIQSSNKQFSRSGTLSTKITLSVINIQAGVYQKRVNLIENSPFFIIFLKSNWIPQNWNSMFNLFPKVNWNRYTNLIICNFTDFQESSFGCPQVFNNSRWISS